MSHDDLGKGNVHPLTCANLLLKISELQILKILLRNSFHIVLFKLLKYLLRYSSISDARYATKKCNY